jgi:hypothetical protein
MTFSTLVLERPRSFGGVECIGPILAKFQGLSGDLFHSNRAPENMGSIREKNPQSLFSWNNLAE